ncbi:MAG TPA: tetratricopeptide repeat protein [Chthoniobacterales bacterium]|nr:tetratricopeptide repeat protein [Chthoniobacterales bacterium]
MAEDQKPKLRLEIAHVLFIDIVGYSKLRTTEQSAQIQMLREIVRNTDQFRVADAEGKLLRLPTGDGGALVFRNLEGPVLCAVEIAKALRSHPDVRVRMGIHSGPVNEVTDLNEQANIAGAGINIAQRVMDCGDAGHILVSKHAAEDLEQYDQWHPYLHDLGECEVKHGERLQLVNFYNHEIGNSALPNRFTKADAPTGPSATASSRRRYSLVAMGLGALVVIGATVLFVTTRTTFRRVAQRVEPASMVSAPIIEKSVAVLPFENLSRDPDNAYFTDGIQDEILTRLSKIAALKVISRTSTQKYKSTPDNLRDVGRQLGVANLLEGSVQKVANAVHVNVQLIRAATDEHLWAESYNRKLDDVFGVEGEVASAIADQLKTKLSGAEQKAIAEKPTQNAAAYDAYLHAVAIDDASTLETTKSVVPLYAKATELDPQFALAWARVSIGRSQLFFNGVDPAINSGATVKEEADRAMSLQPELGEAWLAQGVYRYRVLRDFQGALKSYEEALKRLPNSAYVLEQMAHLERRLGQIDAAQKHYQAAAQLDPRNIGILLTLADNFSSVRHFDEAQKTLDRVLEISPGNENAITSKAGIFQGQGQLKEASEILAKAPADSQEQGIVIQRALQLYRERRFDEAIAQLQQHASPTIANDPRDIVFLGLCQKLVGKNDEARATFTRAVAAMKPTPDSVVPVDARQLPCFLVWAYAGLGEKDKALAQGRQAVADFATDALSKPFAESTLAIAQAQFGDVDSAIAALPHLLEVPNGETLGDLRTDPLWDPLRKDPRFQKLINSDK